MQCAFFWLWAALGVINVSFEFCEVQDYTIIKETKIVFPAVSFQCGPSKHTDGRTELPCMPSLACFTRNHIN